MSGELPVGASRQHRTTPPTLVTTDRAVQAGSSAGDEVARRGRPDRHLRRGRSAKDLSGGSAIVRNG